MSLMQVDAIFLQNFNISGKRLRSSVSPSPSERPQKRMWRDPESDPATPSYAHHTLPVNEDVSMNDDRPAVKRGRSEDWVAKTSGLRLDSPSLSAFGQLLHTGAPFLEGKEHNTANLFLLDRSSTPEPSEPVYNACQEAIDIDIHMNIGPVSNASKEPIENISPPSSGLWPSTALTTPLPQSPRKVKLKMGRRADCDKCRLGVKGHWVHID